MPARIETYASPLRLYRYRSLSSEDVLERELEALSRSYIYCARFSQMNDPMEGTHTESAVLKNTSNYRRLLNEVSEAKAQLGIASFSETHKSEPMWAYYASGFSGMCVAYSFKTLSNALEAGSFVRMVYNEDPPMLLSGRSTPHERAKLALSSKTLRWGPEREWRLINDSSGRVRYGNAKCVSRVYFGSRINPDHEARLRRELQRLKIPVFQMNFDQYALTFRGKLRIRRSK